jgi:DNA polymerase-3 subunit alpha
MQALRRTKVQTLAEIEAATEAGPQVARVAGMISGVKEKKSARGNRFAFVSFSDPTGLGEATMFSDVLEASRRFLEPGAAVVMTVEATLEGEKLKLLARAVQPVDAIAADAGGAGLRIFIETPEAANAVAAVFARIEAEGKTRARGPVEFRVTDFERGAEYALEAGRELPVTPQIKGAIRALRGVAMVEDI